jgi:hypothetical protein
VSVSSVGQNQISKGFFDIKEFKKWMNGQKVHAEITQLGAEKILTIDSIQNPQIQGYQIYYDPVSYKINKMIVGMMRLSPLDDDAAEVTPQKNDEMQEKDTQDLELSTINAYTYYLEIIYQESHPLTLLDGKFRPSAKILKINKDVVELQSAYKDYQLINMMESPEPITN